MPSLGTGLSVGALAFACAIPSAIAAPSAKAKQGLAAAREGDCVKAVPLLEAAEAEEHRPATAAALGKCHLALGEVLLAFEILDALRDESPSQGWTREDKAAHASASESAASIEPRIPTVVFELPESPEGLVVELAGRSVDTPTEPVRVPPDERLTLVASAPKRKTVRDSFTLKEGERKVVRLVLESTGEDAPEDPPEAPSADRPMWLGLRYRGTLVPDVWMNIVGEGGTTTYEPAVEVFLVASVGMLDIVPWVSYQALLLPEMPWKPHDTPNTEWEIVESDLHALMVGLDLAFQVPLDDAGTVSMSLGMGLGVGWAAFGGLYRTQAYPTGNEDDPAVYKKCNGPNDPPGQFRFCNQLDKDIERYGGADRAWGDGGARPLFFPWVKLPALGLGIRPTEGFMIDLETGWSILGWTAGVGGRLAL